jgi:hypothetical protein
MEELKNLVSLVSKQKVKQINIITESGELSPKTKLLYEGILEGSIESDADAAALLYNSRPSHATYKKLISRFEDRIINTLFFIDIQKKDYSPIQRAFHRCYKNYVAVKILVERRRRSTAIYLAEKIFPLAVKYDFTELIVLLARELRFYYGAYQFNKRKLDDYSLALSSSMETLQAELESEEALMFLGSFMNLHKGGVKDEEMQHQLEVYYRRMHKLSKITNSYYFNLTTYNFFVLYYMSKKNYKRIIDVCEEALEKFENMAFKSNTAIFVYKNKLAINYLQFGRLEEAEKLFKQNLKILEGGTLNWFITYNYYFLLACSSEDYQKAYKILQTVYVNPKFKNLYDSQKQLWYVKESYIHFLILLGKIDPKASDQKSLRPFRLNRFLNDVPIYSKDKRGINISILIIQLILMIQNNNLGDIVQRIDSLNQYCYRYLRNDETFRSNCFIKMLIKVPDAAYHPLRVKRYTEKYYNKLKNSNMEISEQSGEIEIIPYEILWELVLEMLEKNN